MEAKYELYKLQLNIPFNLPVILRSMCCRTIKRISNFHFLGFFHGFSQEFLINGLLDENSARSDAVLAFIEENSSHRRFDSSIQVKISKNDQRTFTAQLQGSFLQIGNCTRFHDGFAHRRRARKSEFTNQWVIGDGLSCKQGKNTFLTKPLLRTKRMQNPYRRRIQIQWVRWWLREESQLYGTIRRT